MHSFPLYISYIYIYTYVIYIYHMSIVKLHHIYCPKLNTHRLFQRVYLEIGYVEHRIL